MARLTLRDPVLEMNLDDAEGKFLGCVGPGVVSRAAVGKQRQRASLAPPPVFHMTSQAKNIFTFLNDWGEKNHRRLIWGAQSVTRPTLDFISGHLRQALR